MYTVWAPRHASDGGGVAGRMYFDAQASLITQGIWTGLGLEFSAGVEELDVFGQAVGREEGDAIGGPRQEGAAVAPGGSAVAVATSVGAVHHG